MFKELGAWNTTTVLPADTISYATSVTYNGYVYVMGGGNGDVVFNTVYYAQLSPPTPPISNTSCPPGRRWRMPCWTKRKASPSSKEM